MIKAMARVILWFAILSFMGWYANSLSIRRIIKKVGIRIKFYPAHYIMPSRKMRKIFKLDKKRNTEVDISITVFIICLYYIVSHFCVICSDRWWINNITSISVWIWNLNSCKYHIYGDFCFPVWYLILVIIFINGP